MSRDPTHDILYAAAELAEQGGFDEVRLRDVASRANVALDGAELTPDRRLALVART